ncbi:MAG: hypothetical protein EZS28_004486 [Streblomastix strix]|uniref:Uncharacterized protein n=1 Tax=Streblomastix strix TaxID=222440 RepID=A0A5J4WYQ4_9EUKA|nr:MAG: hypothetical protein EZS28_004486 [Streblomastix strix]
MQSKQSIQDVAKTIISFTDSYTQNKQRKQNEQQESESTLSLTQVTSSLEQLWRQIRNKKSCKQVIRIPKLLQSLISLSRYKVGTHLREQTDLLRLKVRSWSRDCLRYIQEYCDEQDQTELVNVGYGRMTSIAFCTAGGIGEEHDKEIYSGLNRITRFLRDIHEGRNNRWQPSFQPLPLLARRTEEQIEEQGAIEELEAQMNNKGYYSGIMYWTNEAKATILNHFIHRG